MQVAPHTIKARHHGSVQRHQRQLLLLRLLLHQHALRYQIRRQQQLRHLRTDHRLLHACEGQSNVVVDHRHLQHRLLLHKYRLFLTRHKHTHFDVVENLN